MSYLTDIQLVLAPNQKNNYKAFRDSSYHVEEIFRYFLPKRYDLHGMGKIIITLGEHLSRTQQYGEVDLLKIGSYHYPNFQSELYLTLPERQQEEQIVSIIEIVLVDLAERYGADKAVISDAATKTRQSEFKLAIVLPASKFHKSRKYKAEVVLTYRRGGADVDLRLVSKQGTIIKDIVLIRDSWSYEIYHKYRKSRWDHDCFNIYSSNGEPSVTVDFADLINHA